ncbi:hypothetical protein [Rhizobium sp. L1K21]|uniref:hypothetical protein n=1 Tax=Rhizobium sp. L1K21 TaxID=2954933 RepID=UPI00209277C4|nr:hypothetical protein [Rhizobium sp. L1K21]MCO6186790.1 hypothetical protein [Rhizobium sp. L1K21]
MNSRIATSIFILLGLTACTTATDPVSKAWVGKSAGGFFAAYGPPLSETGPNSYRWKGAYSRVNGSLRSCSAVIRVDNDYRIRDIDLSTQSDYCKETLAQTEKK